MKDRFRGMHLLFLTGSLLVIIASCGLKYTPPASDITLEENRQLAIEHQYASSYKALGKDYKSLTYGDMIVVKPDSYRKLDSLYNKKYALQGLGKTDESLESQIDIQRSIVFQDTNPILYVETHWYEINDSVSHEFLIDKISLTNANKIVKVDQIEDFECPKYLLVYARKYMLEDFFVEYTGGGPSDQEIDFYTTYKEKANTLTHPKKQEFIVHTLRVMEIAYERRTLSAEPLLTELTQQAITQQDSTAEVDILKYTVESVVEERDGQESFLYYKVTAQPTDATTPPQIFRYDYFLQPIREE
jgi:hypothetical protein